MSTKDITGLFSNGNGHSLSHTINRAMGRSRSRSFMNSFQRSLGRRGLMMKSSRSSSSGVALPLLIGIGAVALIGAGIDYALRRNEGQGLMSRMNGMVGSLDQFTRSRSGSIPSAKGASVEAPSPEMNG
jgi:hypothetical protein